jgi:hypothetical protein
VGRRHLEVGDERSDVERGIDGRAAVTARAVAVDAARGPRAGCRGTSRVAQRLASVAEDHAMARAWVGVHCAPPPTGTSLLDGDHEPFTTRGTWVHAASVALAGGADESIEIAEGTEAAGGRRARAPRAAGA